MRIPAAGAEIPVEAVSNKPLDAIPFNQLPDAARHRYLAPAGGYSDGRGSGGKGLLSSSTPVKSISRFDRQELRFTLPALSVMVIVINSSGYSRSASRRSRVAS
jgi:hypothetical protein